MHGMTLTALAPVLEVDIHERRGPHGRWHVRIAHRHHAGTWGECEAEVYEDLTRAERDDVVDAALSCLELWPTVLNAADVDAG